MEVVVLAVPILNVVKPRPDIIDIDGLKAPAGSTPRRGPRRPFLSIWYRCCHAYGRLYRNRPETAYEGRCPSCGAQARVGIDPEGSPQRFFEAR